jgi:biopolymer transport protein ExbD
VAMNFEQSAFLDVQDESDLGLNMTPLIDIIFLLLIFFMVTTTFQNKDALSVDLPQASQSGKIDEEKTLELVITSDGQLHLDEKLILAPQLLEKLKTQPGSSLIIRADTSVKHGKVVEALDTAKQAGIKKISIATKTK